MEKDRKIRRNARDMAFAEKRILGRTGLRVGPLGVAASFGAPASAFEEAYERGCNYFYWGSKYLWGRTELFY